MNRLVVVDFVGQSWTAGRHALGVVAVDEAVGIVVDFVVQSSEQADSSAAGVAAVDKSVVVVIDSVGTVFCGGLCQGPCLRQSRCQWGGALLALSQPIPQTTKRLRRVRIDIQVAPAGDERGSVHPQAA